MARKWKNSEGITFFVEKAIENRLEKLRCELITGYAERRSRAKNNGGKKRYPSKNKGQKFDKK